ncbi:Glycosyl hydrolase family protein with chitinase insertion domain [Abeliophyllum distichum]|uniref:Glycosyl hydrolase family protein with chitinase insertion domain n=1 Tax=Abeliophyllum distichum TaxID=126358 RepID=A0ABD1VUJ1_9LAMI
MAFITAKILLLFYVISLLQFNLCIGQNVKGGYWFTESGFAAADIDSSLLTHLFCAFANLDPQTYQLVISSTNNDSFAQFTKIVQLKNPSVKTLLSIGGESANKTVFASIVAQSTSRKTFIDSSIKLARSYGFSGLDLDWEYPQAALDMVNLGSVLKEWHTAMAVEVYLNC